MNNLTQFVRQSVNIHRPANRAESESGDILYAILERRTCTINKSKPYFAIGDTPNITDSISGGSKND
jgi:hypothetical protein